MEVETQQSLRQFPNDQASVVFMPYVNTSHNTKDTQMILKVLILIATLSAAIFLIFQIDVLLLSSSLLNSSSDSPRILVHKNLPNLQDIKNSDLSLNPQDHELGGDHHHQPFILSYPAVGMPVVGQPFNDTPICFKDYRRYEKEQDQLFKPYRDTNCKYERFGRQPGAGFILCQNLLEQSQALLNFGVEAGDQFGCALSSNYLITNYLYACNCEKPNNCPDNEDRTKYQQICLSQMKQINRDNSFTSLKEQIENKGLKGKRIVLKLDVDGAEWMALKTLPIDYLQFIDQMVVIFHNPRHPEITPPLQGYLTILQTLKSHFISVNFHLDNRQCVHAFTTVRTMRKYRSSAIEVTLVNRKLLEAKSQQRTYQSNFKNIISTMMQFDCQMLEID